MKVTKKKTAGIRLTGLVHVKEFFVRVVKEVKEFKTMHTAAKRRIRRLPDLEAKINSADTLLTKLNDGITKQEEIAARIPGLLEQLEKAVQSSQSAQTEITKVHELKTQAATLIAELKKMTDAVREARDNAMKELAEIQGYKVALKQMAGKAEAAEKELEAEKISLRKLGTDFSQESAEELDSLKAARKSFDNERTSYKTAFDNEVAAFKTSSAAEIQNAVKTATATIERKANMFGILLCIGFFIVLFLAVGLIWKNFHNGRMNGSGSQLYTAPTVMNQLQTTVPGEMSMRRIALPTPSPGQNQQIWGYVAPNEIVYLYIPLGCTIQKYWGTPADLIKVSAVNYANIPGNMTLSGYKDCGQRLQLVPGAPLQKINIVVNN